MSKCAVSDFHRGNLTNGEWILDTICLMYRYISLINTNAKGMYVLSSKSFDLYVYNYSIYVAVIFVFIVFVGLVTRVEGNTGH